MHTQLAANKLSYRYLDHGADWLARLEAKLHEVRATHDASDTLRPPIAGMIFAWQNAIDLAMCQVSRKDSGHV